MKSEKRAYAGKFLNIDHRREVQALAHGQRHGGDHRREGDVDFAAVAAGIGAVAAGGDNADAHGEQAAQESPAVRRKAADSGCHDHKLRNHGDRNNP